MSNVGRLCYKRGGSALCYKRGGSALIYKVNKDDEPGAVTIRIPWSPQAYTCVTYGAYHDLTFGVVAQGSQGAFGVMSQEVGGTETVIRIESVREGPAELLVELTCLMDCAADEDPGVTCRVLAKQDGGALMAKSGISVPRSGGVIVRVKFDAQKKLYRIE